MRYEAHDASPARHRGGHDLAPRRRPGGVPAGRAVVARRVDTVYLGAFRAETIRSIGGYDEWSGGNEDAELAWRAQQFGGVYLDPSIKSVLSRPRGAGTSREPVLPVRPQPGPDDPQAPASLSFASWRFRPCSSAGQPLAPAGACGLSRRRARAGRPRAVSGSCGGADARGIAAHDARRLGCGLLAGHARKDAAPGRPATGSGPTRMSVVGARASVTPARARISCVS